MGISAKIEDLAKKNENMEMIKTNIDQIKKVCEIAYTELEQEIKTIINNVIIISTM